MNAEEQARDERYQEVSLRAVELLAKAQRAADEAVAEAQSYARDLEDSAREQYKQILLRAQSAAQQLTTAEGAGEPATALEGSPSAVDAQQLAYVRTYARVAHAQLKSVLAALNDELDQLAAMADGSVQGPAMPVPVPGPQAPLQAAQPVTPPESTPAFVPNPPSPAGPAPQSQPRPAGPLESAFNVTAEHHSADDTHSWPPIAAPTNSISYFYGGSTWQGPRV